MNAQQQPITFKLDNKLSELDRLSELLNTIGEQWSLSSSVVLQINLVLDELFTNLVCYGLEEGSEEQITITLNYEIDRIKIILSDAGKAFDPTIPQDPDLDVPLDEKEVGGLGIFLVRQYTDNIDYRRENDRNIVTLTKKI